MKKLLALLLPVLFYSCTSDNVEEYYGVVDCATLDVSYSEDIAQIISTNCAISGCHVSGTGLPDWTKYENLVANADEIRRKTFEGEMPPPFSGKSLTIEEVRMISCWVNSGTPNN